MSTSRFILFLSLLLASVASFTVTTPSIALADGCRIETKQILAIEKPLFQSRSHAFGGAKRDLGIPANQKPLQVRLVPLTDRNERAIIDSNGKPQLSREYIYKRPSNGKLVVIQEHSAGHHFGEKGGVGDQGPHFNVRPVEDTRHGRIEGTRDHYSWK
ncbi:MAG: hypothetical protein A2583_16260 [Bdellovibrionales bacterium RIFOXYD1_FULL_53_11]|nr:MAG: hypothetical protein A2583_16260 [Bdellovibrionales bacterium RIFOXYD1_FULL_53_11]